ncbi:hypothetical protein H696_03931 [Fonticula alba]|uniref:Ribosomal protein L37 n=1 Tax=Fonticula alba TaxID=691883 RepID=A0A058Z5G7_FONAL|nr:hypothetical protein H696_03931 [Fonticula alba]KCV69509.1 hypothetical protein H696_03931 [Fonticula alba]|eukprot:XP_009496074.1 hypothetical protein H696_03931 [Fonticula alba]
MLSRALSLRPLSLSLARATPSLARAAYSGGIVPNVRVTQTGGDPPHLPDDQYPAWLWDFESPESHLNITRPLVRGQKVKPSYTTKVLTASEIDSEANPKKFLKRQRLETIRGENFLRDKSG